LFFGSVEPAVGSETAGRFDDFDDAGSTLVGGGIDTEVAVVDCWSSCCILLVLFTSQCLIVCECCRFVRH
jgi:hypothetical protein